MKAGSSFARVLDLQLASKSFQTLFDIEQTETFRSSSFLTHGLWVEIAPSILHLNIQRSLLDGQDHTCFHTAGMLDGIGEQFTYRLKEKHSITFRRRRN